MLESLCATLEPLIMLEKLDLLELLELPELLPVELDPLMLAWLLRVPVELDPLMLAPLVLDIPVVLVPLPVVTLLMLAVVRLVTLPAGLAGGIVAKLCSCGHCTHQALICHAWIRFLLHNKISSST